MIRSRSRFHGQVALITGASSGIGEALARQLAAEGAGVALLARRSDRITKIAGELAAQGGRAISVVGDVTRDGDIENAVKEVESKLGRLDMVFANAGFSVSGPISNLKIEDYRRQFETNVFGVLRTVFATLPLLKKTRGRLVLLGSVLGHVTMPEVSPYAMSKFAVRALADSIRGELLGEGVSVTLISPGFVASEIRHIDNEGRLVADSKDAVPAFMVMSAQKAAADILNATYRRKAERIVTAHGKAIVLLSRYAPAFLIRFLQAQAASKR